MPEPSTGHHNLAIALALEDAGRAVDRLFAESGLPSHRHVLRVLRGERVGGRPLIDDTTRLADVRRLVGIGRAPWSACSIVARATTEATRASVARRLFRKL